VILFSPDIQETIFIHAREGYPNEVCGVLVGKSDGMTLAANRKVIMAVRAKNIEEVRKNDRYQIAPDDMIHADVMARKHGLDIVGFYHSHPDHPAVASVTDLENSSPWGFYSYPIVSVLRGEVADFRSWYREGDAWVEEEMKMEDL
jgi:proteasome lid subunit RPN8/RPN11